LSLDFDSKKTPEEVLNIVITRVRPRSVIVFHDSVKAWDRLKFVLPKVLDFALEKGYRMEVLEE